MTCVEPNCNGSCQEKCDCDIGKMGRDENCDCSCRRTNVQGGLITTDTGEGESISVGSLFVMRPDGTVELIGRLKGVSYIEDGLEAYFDMGEEGMTEEQLAVEKERIFNLFTRDCILTAYMTIPKGGQDDTGTEENS